MSVTQNIIIWSTDFGNLSDWQAADDNAYLASGKGWINTGQAIDGISTATKIKITNFPLPIDTKVIGITVNGKYTGSTATIHGCISYDTSGQDCSNQNIGVSGQAYSFGINQALGDYGTPLNSLIVVYAPVNNGGNIIIDNIQLIVLVDDSLPEGLPGNPQEPPPIADCVDTILYDYGTGPDCVQELHDYTFKFYSSTTLKVLEFTFATATQFTFKGYTNWSPVQTTQDPYIVIRDHEGNVTSQYGHDTNNDVFAHQVRAAGNKVTIFGPVDNNPTSIVLTIEKIYTTQDIPTDNTGNNYGDIFTGLNGIVGAINAETSTLDDTIATHAFNVTHQLNLLPNSLAQELLKSGQTLLGGFPAFLEGLVSGNVSISPNIVQALFDFVTTAAKLIGADLKIATTTELTALSTVFNNTFGSVSSSIDNTISAQGDVVDNLLNGQYATSQQFFNALQGAGNNTQLLTTMQNVYALVIGTFDLLKSKSDIADIEIKQLLLGEYTPSINDLSTLIQAYRKGFVTLEYIKKQAARLGFNTERLNNFIEATRTILNFEQIKELYLKGFITELQHDHYLFMWGMNDDTIEQTKTNYQILPSPTDITRLADKHIFSGDIATSFGQYDEIPQAYIDNMAKWGINAEWTRKLWAGHWSLPGLQDSFDMFHRGIISEEQLNTFFALTDIMPFFREKLKQLNYSLITRVDIRRFYADGVFTESQVYDAYRKLGYDDTGAKLQTQFTVVHERLSESPAKVKIRELTQTMVVKAYKEGIISKDDAISRLGKVGYLADNAELILDLETQIANTAIVHDKTQYYHDKTVKLILDDFAKGVISESDVRAFLTQIGVPLEQITSEIYYASLERITNLKNLVITHVRTAYTAGQITKSEAQILMSSKGFSQGEIDFLFEELDTLILLRNKPLTLTDIKGLYKAGVITVGDVEQELMNLGYTEKHVIWLLAEIVGVS